MTRAGLHVRTELYVLSRINLACMCLDFKALPYIMESSMVKFQTLVTKIRRTQKTKSAERTPMIKNVGVWTTYGMYSE